MTHNPIRCLYVLTFTLFAGAFALADFTPLTPLPSPRILSSSEPYPGDNYKVTNLFDNRPGTEYSSNSKGADTFVEVEFPQPVRIGAFRHLDRNDPATVGASELVILDTDGKTTQMIPITHANKPGGETFFVLPTSVSAQRLRWHITKLGPQNYGTVGGAEITFFAAGDPETFPSRDSLDVRTTPLLRKDSGPGLQLFRLTLNHPYAQPVDATLRLQGSDTRPIRLAPGQTTLEVGLPPVSSDATTPVSLEINAKTVAKSQLMRRPFRPLTVYILPHSHTDIGYTEIQTAIEKKQVQNLIDGIAHARRTASYPQGARFVWNVEVLWAADLYMRRLTDAQRADFLDAVKKGYVALNGMYLNELTGLCRPEELLRLFRFATQLSTQTGAVVDSVMISDVPGYTWGTVTAMNHAGIKYFSTAPNYFDRIGTILREWENKPFYWVGPDGKSKVLVWIPFWGYAMSHRYHSMSPKLVEDLCDGLEKRNYPYDIAHVRWAGLGDNAIPDPSICEFVKDWNAQYHSPHFIISGTSEAFAAFEKRYADTLPVVRGDWTPYWEDGAGSSALQTAVNRHSSDRLAQAETLFAILKPKSYPAARFQDAWNNVLLYSEHTWGAWCSVSEPHRKETIEQWQIKRSYAELGDQQSRNLLAIALAPSTSSSNSLDLYNTVSWTRTELAILPPSFSSAGDRVIDDHENPVPSQRLTNGSLAFLAADIPPFSARRFTVVPGKPVSPESKSTALGSTLDNGVLLVRLDQKTGGIVELAAKSFPNSPNFADTSAGESLNDYLYLPGDDLKNLQRNAPVKISVGENGPLIASLIVQSDAPGCKSLRREITLAAGADHVTLTNLVDKARLDAKSYMDKTGKESVNFAFPFNVPNGQILLDIPLGLMRPETDQMPSACKNWFTVGRFADVSNADYGITWVTLDAPLLQVGAISANLLNSQYNPDVWRKTVEPTTRLYSWAMNNHWGTNYRAYQEGPTTFRFVLRPHRAPDLADASRFAITFSYPLLPRLSDKTNPIPKPLLTLANPNIFVSALKPSDDAKSIILRLYNPTLAPQSTTLAWPQRPPKSLFLSDTTERPREKAPATFSLPPNALITVLAQFD